MKTQMKTFENYDQFVYAFNKPKTEESVCQTEKKKNERRVLDGRVSRMLIFSLIGAAIIAFRLLVF